jgi:hypothetical protein
MASVSTLAKTKGMGRICLMLPTIISLLSSALSGRPKLLSPIRTDSAHTARFGAASAPSTACSNFLKSASIRGAFGMGCGGTKFEGIGPVQGAVRPSQCSRSMMGLRAPQRDHADLGVWLPIFPSPSEQPGEIAAFWIKELRVVPISSTTPRTRFSCPNSCLVASAPLRSRMDNGTRMPLFAKSTIADRYS